MKLLGSLAKVCSVWSQKGIESLWLSGLSRAAVLWKGRGTSRVTNTLSAEMLRSGASHPTPLHAVASM